MQIKIKETLRELRHKKGVTQEMLATHLNITSQSVGKWERGEGFPDITLLPAIALYFGVTVDTLLGVEEARIEEKIAEYDRKACAYSHVGKVTEEIAVREEAYAEFPNDCRVIHGLMFALFFENAKMTEDRGQKIIALGVRLLEESKDAYFRQSAIQVLTYTYDRLGDKENALRYADMGGDLWVTAMDLRASVLKGEEGIVANQTYLLNLLRLVALAAGKLYSLNTTPEEKIAALKFAASAALLPFPEDENIGYTAISVSGNLMLLAICYAKLGKQEEALDALEGAAKYAVMSTQRPTAPFRSPMVNRLSDDPASEIKNYTGNACNLRLIDIGDRVFDALRSDERFALIKATLKEYAETV